MEHANTQQLLAKAVALHQAGNLAQAEALYSTVLATDPNQPDAYINRGIALYEMQRYEEALADYDKAIALAPDYAIAHNNRGNALQQLKRYDDAAASYDKAIALKSDYVEAYNNRGIALQEMQRYGEAIASYDKAIAFKPDYAEAYYNRGNSLQSVRRYENALDSYDKAIAFKPDYAAAYNNRGNVLRIRKRYHDALANYDQAIAITPDIPYLHGYALHSKMHICQWQDIGAAFEKLAKDIEAGKPVAAPLITLAASSSAAVQRACAEIYAKEHYPKAEALWQGERYAHAKIRVAYVSADFREHPLSFLMAGVFEHHDRMHFETHGISLMPEDDSATGRRVKAAFDSFIDVSQKSDQEVARLLRDLEIDIAVDLMGFTAGNRTHIFASRPAPVQINYLGYPGTMGAPYMDYIIADTFVIPPQSQLHYAEKIVYLPCFQANDGKRFMPREKPSREKCGLPEEGLVFCSFNNSYKINPAIFDVWMRLLKAVPGSLLWLLGNDAVGHNLRAEAKSRGVDSARLIFAAKVKYEEHLARLANADIFLDTLPFNAGATASDALWAGVPLVTCAGEAFAARMAGSLLIAVGLPELVTTQLKDYEALALRLATNPKRLASIRAKLAKNRTTQPLFDTARFTKHLEHAYRNMWEKTEAGLPADYIDVTARSF